MPFQKLKEENELVRERVEDLQADLAAKTKEFEATEEKLRQEIKQLTNENQTSAREVRELGVKLTALQAKSPQVREALW